jgi:hypothetical protein
MALITDLLASWQLIIRRKYHKYGTTRYENSVFAHR